MMPEPEYLIVPERYPGSYRRKALSPISQDGTPARMTPLTSSELLLMVTEMVASL